MQDNCSTMSTPREPARIVGQAKYISHLLARALGLYAASVRPISRARDDRVSFIQAQTRKAKGTYYNIIQQASIIRKLIYGFILSKYALLVSTITNC